MTLCLSESLQKNLYLNLSKLHMHFIYVLTLTDHYQDPAHWDEDTSAKLDMHWNYLVDLHARDVMQFVGRTSYAPGDKDLFGIAVFSAADEAEATRIMQADPAIVHGIMTARLHPFNLSLIAGKEPV